MARDDILRSIYFGESIPWETNHPLPPERKGVWTDYERKVSQLSESLSQEQVAILESLLSDRAVIESESLCNGFVDGFRMGARVILAVMDDCEA